MRSNIHEADGVNTLRPLISNRLFAKGFWIGRATIAAWETRVNYDRMPSAITFSPGDRGDR